jgi:hypothetical protein
MRALERWGHRVERWGHISIFDNSIVEYGDVTPNDAGEDIFIGIFDE